MTTRVAPIFLISLLLAACPKSDSGGGTTPPPSTTKAARHERCDAATACDTGLTCVAYNGFTGQELHSCEIPCDGKEDTCPAGEQCGTVMDGPHDVCVASPPPDQSGVLPKQGEKCPDNQCDAGLTCVEYYGIAGARGPKFTSCEIPCKGGAACPQGQKCITIADGPGQVCRAQP